MNTEWRQNITFALFLVVVTCFVLWASETNRSQKPSGNPIVFPNDFLLWYLEGVVD